MDNLIVKALRISVGAPVGVLNESKIRRLQEVFNGDFKGGICVVADFLEGPDIILQKQPCNQ